MAHPLNAEAGYVAVPDDPAVLAASLRAAEISWRVTPYYELRYGARGWAFSKSDSAWQATLPTNGLDYTRRQLNWLAPLLSTRGMPSTLLEDHLRVMRHVLDRRVPSRRNEWKQFTIVRDELVAARHATMPEAELEQRAARFAADVGMSAGRIAVRTGRLLAAARSDADRFETPRPVTSMSDWFCDPERFSSDWVRAAHAALDI